mmetsp:Transcript_12656/g.19680  ORF Transcript_12656/g.19680 Transcript_12656/m.19680 type:complete len:84 (+) Transcript_12656:137-388(+)
MSTHTDKLSGSQAFMKSQESMYPIKEVGSASRQPILMSLQKSREQKSKETHMEPPSELEDELNKSIDAIDDVRNGQDLTQIIP